MSLNGFNGQPGRPLARPGGDHSLGAPAQPAWPHAQEQQPNLPPITAGHGAGHNTGHGAAQGAGHGGYAQQGYGQYGGYGGQGSDPYAPNFQPYNPGGQPRTGGRPAAQSQPAPQYAAPLSSPAEPTLSQAAYAQAHQAYAAQQRGAVASQAVHAYGQSAPQKAEPAFGHQNFGQGQAAQTSAGQYQPYYGEAAPAPQWAQAHEPTARYDQAGYAPHAGGFAQGGYPGAAAEPGFADWQQGYAPQEAPGYDYGDGQGYDAPPQNHDAYGDMGFAQPHGGQLEQAYEQDEDYEAEEESGARRPLMIVAALAGAVLVGGSMAYGYKAFFGGGPSGSPPVVRTADLPTKTKPADAGGKKFDHTDSKIMGRLGDGSGAASAEAASDADTNGTRRVATLVVGRDGSIMAPPAEPAAPSPEPAGNDTTSHEAAPAANGAPAVPGMMVVDALGPRGGAQSPVQSAPSSVVVVPPAEPEKPATVAKAEILNNPQKAQTGSIAEEEAAPVKKPAAKKVAAVAPSDTMSDAQQAAPVTANGYVAVIASVPKSASSRMDALKQFADLQQKYGDILTGKTPDVAEANLGAKGAYHRLIVGPPTSRRDASTLCTQLKAQGYASCWVTTY